MRGGDAANSTIRTIVSWFLILAASALAAVRPAAAQGDTVGAFRRL